MRRRRRALALLLACLVAAACSPARLEPLVHGAPRAVPLDRAHYFGEVPPGTPVQHRFEIVNRGDRVLELEPVRTSCGCSASLAGADTVVPGESGAITVALDTEDEIGPRSAWVRVKTNDPLDPELELVLHGRVAGDVRVQTRRLYLGRVEPDEKASATVDVELTSPAVEISSIKASSERLRVRAARLASPARGVRLHVTLPPQHTFGRINDRIVVATTSELQPRVEIEVLASVE